MCYVRLGLITILIMCAMSLSAQPRLEKVLLPTVLLQPVPGAFGSLWNTQTTFFNKGASPLYVGGLLPCPVEPCLSLIPAQATLAIAPAPPASGVAGKFLYIPTDRRGDFAVAIRAYDSSRLATNFGTEVPAVLESEAKSGTVELLGVPTAAPFRALVRIYDFDPGEGHAVIVRIMRPRSEGDQLIGSTMVGLKSDPDTLDFPGFGQIDLSAIGLGETVRVEIAPMTQGLRFWAMASITNNDTQHVTIVTPR